MATIGIQWYSDDKEYGWPWRDWDGDAGPLLAVGSIVSIKNDDNIDPFEFVLKVKEIRAYYDVNKLPAHIIMFCEVVEVVEDVEDVD